MLTTVKTPVGRSMALSQARTSRGCVMAKAHMRRYDWYICDRDYYDNNGGGVVSPRWKKIHQNRLLLSCTVLVEYPWIAFV
jgi:hypothetical protein